MTGMLPRWLFYDFWWVLSLAEIYPQIRAIAVRYSQVTGEVFIRCYLDREPTEFDRESIGVISGLLHTNNRPHSEVSKITEECVFSNEHMQKLDPLDGFVYRRREYEMQDNPSQLPTYFDFGS